MHGKDFCTPIEITDFDKEGYYKFNIVDFAGCDANGKDWIIPIEEVLGIIYMYVLSSKNFDEDASAMISESIKHM